MLTEPPPTRLPFRNGPSGASVQHFVRPYLEASIGVSEVRNPEFTQTNRTCSYPLRISLGGLELDGRFAQNSLRMVSPFCNSYSNQSSPDQESKIRHCSDTIFESMFVFQRLNIVPDVFAGAVASKSPLNESTVVPVCTDCSIVMSNDCLKFVPNHAAKSFAENCNSEGSCFLGLLSGNT